MNRDRLIRLAALLDRVQAEDRNFYIGEWTCGTSACALGWAAQEPDFIAEGLFLRTGDRWPCFAEQIGMGAGAAFFGISQVESRYLFDPEYYEDDEVMWDKITPADVAARVRELLDGEVAPMIGTAAFLNTGPDAGHVYVGDPDAHLFAPAHPAPVMPPACVPGLPDAVVAILLEAHADVICSGKTWLDMSTDPTMTNRAYYRRAIAVQHAARAVAITHALRDAGHHTEADALRAKAAALAEALHVVPAEMLERMDLMDKAIPGGWL